MAFIKAQKIVRDSSGVIIKGSAAIVDTIYVSTKSRSHSKQQVREKLGKVVFLSDDHKSGIFMSPTRGLIEYNSITDEFTSVNKDDPRVNDTNCFPETEIHTVFGDTYLLLNFLEKQDIISVLRTVFPKDEEYERILCHILHGILKDGSRISCDNFIQKSFASYVFKDIPIGSLHSDTRFFSLLGDDNKKMLFFKTFIAMMQKKNKNFGKACYVDSTPLPNDIDDNPFNALCCHGVASSEVMTRLILVLDEESGLPVWYDIIPGNVLDINTVMTVVNDVADSLGIEIDSLVLDAGYVSKELIGAFHIGTDKKIIGRMPARRGYPFKTLYWEVKELIGKGKYAFVRNHHTYFGVQKKIELFENNVFAYIYVDQNNALKRFGDYLTEHEEEYSELKAKDKDWLTVKNGYFVLISNRDTTPKNLLSEYFSRTDIEVVFKASKEYLDLLPLSKWTDQTVRGKILHDIINTICLLNLRKELNNTGKSVSEIIGKCQALMCYRNRNDIVTVETPSKQVKEYYKLLEIDVPAHVNLNKFTTSIMQPKM
jgi:hypothetical protein